MPFDSAENPRFDAERRQAAALESSKTIDDGLLEDFREPLFEVFPTVWDFVHSARMITPTDIARELGIDAKALRRFLRRYYTRPEIEKHQRWFFTRAEGDKVKRMWRRRV